MKALSSPSAMHTLTVEYYSDLYTVDESDALYGAELFQNLSKKSLKLNSKKQ